MDASVDVRSSDGAGAACATALELRDVGKSYGPLIALQPLSLAVRPGEMLALLGPSGCGKTTTLRIIGGFEFPDTGHVLLGGRDVTDLPPNRRGLGMVFQNYGLFPHMSVGENVAFGLRMRGAGRAAREAQVRRMLEMVRLGGTEGRRIGQLSGGQQQRVALARALAPEPRILLLDEPLGALDKNLREGMQFELRRIQRELGITAILVTHDQEEALTMSDRVAVMSRGVVEQIGPPTEVYDRPGNRFVAEFLGTANIFPATILATVGPSLWSVRLDGLDAQGVVSGEAPAPGRAVQVLVRPERLRIGPPAPGAVACTVADLVFRGATCACEMLVPGREAPVFVYTQARTALVRGEAAGLTWAPGEGVVLRGAA